MSAQRIDWDGIKKRLEDNARALDDLFVTNVSRNKKVFQERAERMAARVASMARKDMVSVVTFVLGTERYCLPIEELAEIIPYQNCKPVPGVAAEICGVIPVRGEIRCIMDLARLLQLTNGEGPSYILLLRRHSVGLRVGTVQKVERVERAVSGSRVHDEDEQPLIFLDLERIFNHNVFHEVF